MLAIANCSCAAGRAWRCQPLVGDSYDSYHAKFIAPDLIGGVKVALTGKDAEGGKS